MTFEFSVHPSFNFLESFAQKLQVPVRKYSLSIPPSLGQGYVKKIDLEASMKFVLHHYTLTEPFHLRRLPSQEGNDLVSIIFNSHEIPLDPSSGKEEAIQFIKTHGAAIQVASSNIGTESFFPAGSEVFFGVIGVKPGILSRLLGVESPNNLLRTIFAGDVTPFFYHENMFPEAQRVLKQLAVLHEDSQLAPLHYRIKVLELLYLLFERLLRRETAPQSAINMPDLEKLYQVKSAISQDLSIPPRLPELARSVQMSETKMKQLFRQVFGDTIYNYYQQLRLEQAAFLLKQGRYTVSEVGYQLGFSNLSHFGRLFEKHYGLKPKKYLVMAPMTRSRAIHNIPNDLMALYYGQRTDAGLIITEGTAPTPEALGYPRIPGLFNEAQVAGWQKVTAAVHKGGSSIFVQLMHTGRIGHNDNLPENNYLVGPSDIKASGEVFTDTKGMQPYSAPVPLSEAGIAAVIEGFVQAAQNAMAAGFDGVELHAANGYLLEQFLNPHVNNRSDRYGGDLYKRSRLILEVTEQVAAGIGKERLGIRFSPFSQLGDLPPYPAQEVEDTYAYLAREMNRIGIAYLHIAGNPQIPASTYSAIRSAFGNTLILNGGFTPESAAAALQEGRADLVAFGRNFLANPDLIRRIETNAPLNQPDYSKLYTPGEAGYTDYAVL